MPLLESPDKLRIAPRAARVVDADRFVRLEVAVEILRRREADLAERNAHVGMDFAFDVNALRIGHHVVGALGSRESLDAIIEVYWTGLTGLKWIEKQGRTHRPRADPISEIRLSPVNPVSKQKNHARKRMAENLNSSLPTAALPASGLRGRPAISSDRTLSHWLPRSVVQNRTRAGEVNARNAACPDRLAASEITCGRYSFFCASVAGPACSTLVWKMASHLPFSIFQTVPAL